MKLSEKRGNVAGRKKEAHMPKERKAKMSKEGKPRNRKDSELKRGEKAERAERRRGCKLKNKRKLKDEIGQISARKHVFTSRDQE